MSGAERFNFLLSICLEKGRGEFQIRNACVEITGGHVSIEEFFIEDSHAPRISASFLETGSPDLHCPQTDITICLTNRKCRLFPASMGRDRKDSIV